MATEIKMPQLSDTMSSGKIIAWRKNVGEAVKRGEVLAEVETDKANLEIESFHDGILLAIEVAANHVAQVGQTIAVLGRPGEGIAAASQPVPVVSGVSTSPQSGFTHVKVAATGSPVAHRGPAESRVKASPLAKQVAKQLNVDLTVLHGSGPQGRILRKDVERAGNLSGDSIFAGTATRQAGSTEDSSPQARTQLSSEVHGSEPGQAELKPLSRMRETIARRMVESVTQSPHFYTTISVDMRQAVKLREFLKENPDYKGISVNHLIIKAAAYALSRESRVNCAMRENQVFHPASINIGIITAIEDGLLIPVIRDTDKLSLRDLVFEAKAAVERAKAGRPNATDLSGGTFSISNMGMFDVENFTAIINPGQGAVLAVSSSRQVPVVESGVVVPGLEMKVTLSVDHRIIDGVMAATFLKHFKAALELPALLSIDR